MPEPTHFFVPCAGAGMPNACKHNALVSMGSFFDARALAQALKVHGWCLFIGNAELETAPQSIYLALCPTCSLRYSKDVKESVAGVLSNSNKS
jgi:hypothetical protein